MHSEIKLAHLLIKPCLLVVLGGVVSLLLALLPFGWASLILVVLFSSFAMSLVRFNILHPLVWFLPFLILYHYSALVLHFLDLRELNSSDQMFWMVWWSILVFSVVGSFFSAKKFNREYCFVDRNYSVFVLFFFAFLAVVVFINFYFISSGFSSKADVREGGLTKLYPLIGLCLFFSCGIIYSSFVKKDFFSKILVFTSFFAFIFTSLSLGERNFLFAFLAFFLLSAFANGKIRLRYVYIFGLVCVLLIPVMGALKNVFSKDSGFDFDFAEILLKVIDGEFRSAGMNLDTLIYFEGYWEYFGGSLFIDNLLRSFVPNFILGVDGGVAWFNKTFHPEVFSSGRGYGFSILGEGYANFGVYGIIITSFFLSSFVCFLYRAALKSSTMMFVYLYSVPIFIYSVRADLSNILSPFVKGILIPVLGVYFVSHVLRQVLPKGRAHREIG